VYLQFGSVKRLSLPLPQLIDPVIPNHFSTGYQTPNVSTAIGSFSSTPSGRPRRTFRGRLLIVATDTTQFAHYWLIIICTNLSVWNPTSDLLN
jgi:hypothetical protein